MSITVGKDPLKENLTPSPDGLNDIFYTSQDYKPKSISVWLNGIKLIKDWDDGFEETGDDEITMNEAPISGDFLQAEYEPS